MSAVRSQNLLIFAILLATPKIAKFTEFYEFQSKSRNNYNAKIITFMVIKA